jgi:hypothetical protein
MAELNNAFIVPSRGLGPNFGSTQNISESVCRFEFKFVGRLFLASFLSIIIATSNGGSN